MSIPNQSARLAPGAPGTAARWTSSAKVGVGTALSTDSHVWFTLSHGIFNEIYYPRIDQACVRDMGLIITDGAAFFSEEKRDADSGVHWLAKDVPAFELINVSRDRRYRIEKQTLTEVIDALLKVETPSGTTWHCYNDDGGTVLFQPMTRRQR